MAGFVLPIISGLAGLFGGGQQQKTTTSSNQTGSQQQQYGSSGTTTPNLSPFQQQLAQMFTKGTMDQFQGGTNLAPYTAQGLQQIQGQGTAQGKTISNILASRGLSYSPAAATSQIQNTLNTGNQMNSFLQGVPLLQHQLQQGNLQQLMQAFGVQPTGVTTDQSGQSSGTSQQQGQQTQTTSGNPLAGLFGGVGSAVAAMPNLFNSLGGGGGNFNTPFVTGAMPPGYQQPSVAPPPVWH